MKLKYRLEKFEKALVFQVLEMDDRFRCEKGGFQRVHTAKGFHVFSDYTPQLSQCDGVYLRGKDEARDLEIQCLNFVTNKDRDEQFDKIQAAIEDWANNWDGFKCDTDDSVKLIRHGEDDEFIGFYTLKSHGEVRLEFTLREYPLSLFFQIHYMDESFRATPENPRVVFSGDRWDICSASTPHFLPIDSEIFLCGRNKEHDHTPSIKVCDKSGTWSVDAVKTSLLSDLKLWAAEWFKPEPLKIKQNDDGSYEV